MREIHITAERNKPTETHPAFLRVREENTVRSSVHSSSSITSLHGSGKRTESDTNEQEREKERERKRETQSVIYSSEIFPSSARNINERHFRIQQPQNSFTVSMQLLMSLIIMNHLLKHPLEALNAHTPLQCHT